MHLDEELVQRLLHGELAPAAETPVREHLAECPDCRARVVAAGRAERTVHTLLAHLDHPPPRVDAGTLAARARARSPGWLRWAAGILLVAGLAGAAYAAPGSPVRGWVQAALQRIGGGPVAVPEAPGPAEPLEVGPSGIAVAPGAGLLILFTSRQAEGEARVTLTDDAQVMVRALTGAVIFTSDVDRLVVENRGSSATFEIQIPRRAPRVEIRVDGIRMFLKDGSETHGSRVFRLIPGGS